MKRIIVSSLTLLAIAGITVGGTIAFFSDSEVSEGNTFAAGSVDLKVDHTKQTYNGEDCTTQCDRFAKEVATSSQGQQLGSGDVEDERSNPSAALGAPQSTGNDFDGANAGSDFFSLGFGGSITLEFPSGIDDGSGDDIRIYEATGGTSYPVESIMVEVSPDGNDWETIEVTPEDIEYDGTVEIDLNGAPTARFVRLTDTTDPADHAGNPSADGYDVDAVEALHCANEETDGQASSAWQCELFGERDLTDETFFNFSDIKPGDTGSNVISLHAEGNDAYACLISHNGQSAENTVYESEEPDSEPDGEVQNYIDFFAWNDIDNDGQFEPDAGEMALGDTTLGDMDTLASQDSNNSEFLSAGTTEYVGLAWCAGEQTVNETTGDIDCDPAGMHNDAQSDSYTSSLTAYAEQVRNNDSFSCDAVDLDSSNPDVVVN